MARRQKVIPTNEHVFDDGMTFKKLRDAIKSAGAIGMFHVSHQMAHQYRMQDVLCMRCGNVSPDPQKHTYFTHNNLAIRCCMPCAADRRR